LTYDPSARFTARILIVIAGVAGVAAVWPASGTAQVEPPPVQVRVTKSVQGPGRVVYRYEVLNGSAFPITALSIGNDYFDDETELDMAPLGWNGDSLPRTPASSVESPPNWKFGFIPTEGGEPGTADWNAATPAHGVMGGDSLGGFAVILLKEDSAYEQGHWTAYLNTNEEILYSGSLQSIGARNVSESSIFAKSDLRIELGPAGVGIQFVNPVAGGASVEVFDEQGRLVRRVASKPLAAGNASLTWDRRDDAGRAVAGGVYLVMVKTPTTVRFGRFTIPK